MATRSPLEAHVISRKSEMGQHFATVFGIEVSYDYEEADPSVGIEEARYIQAVKLGGQWLDPWVLRPDFLVELHDELGAGAYGRRAA